MGLFNSKPPIKKRPKGVATASQIGLGQLFFLLLFPLCSWADQDLKYFENTADVVVIQKTINRCAQKKFQARVTIHQPIDMVGSILMDIPFYSHWIRNCNRIVLLEGRDAMAAVAYFEMDMPWPLSNREVIFRIKTTLDPERKMIRIQGEALKNHPYPVAESNVRITNAEFNITLEKREPYKTSMTVTNWFDFGGKINESVSSMFAGASLFSAMTNFKELSKFSRYNRVLLCREEFKQVLRDENPDVHFSQNNISVIRQGPSQTAHTLHEKLLWP